MLAMLVVAGILLFPDLAALEVPGVLRLERQLKEQVKRQDDIVEMVRRIEMSQRQQVTVINATAAEAARFGELAAQQELKWQRFESDVRRARRRGAPPP